MSKKINKMEAPRGLITPDEAKELDQAYDSRHELISESILKRPDNRSTWYAIEEIEKFLDYAKNQAKDLGYTLDGIRIYEGAYPDVKDEVGYTTMFLIPTGTPNNKNASRCTSIDGGDIPGGSGLNKGNAGTPPNSNYPQ
ncbi:hypothetical protein ACFFVB_16675 [Formosa undariae]|uniref:Uncharacterized protein n=1 Tax=Formosa undariae TaxID=1325436 RepID=A0ABV5F5K1_9FLAO